LPTGPADVFEQEWSLSLGLNEEQTGPSLHRQHFTARGGMLESRESLHWSDHAFGSEHRCRIGGRPDGPNGFS